MATKNMAKFSNVGCRNNITIHDLESVFNKSVIGKLSSQHVLTGGVEIKWSGEEGYRCDDCVKSNWKCGYNTTENTLICFCLEGQYGGVCSK